MVILFSFAIRSRAMRVKTAPGVGRHQMFD
jgi:hypothetical protein